MTPRQQLVWARRWLQVHKFWLLVFSCIHQPRCLLLRVAAVLDRHGHKALDRAGTARAKAQFLLDEIAKNPEQQAFWAAEKDRT